MANGSPIGRLEERRTFVVTMQAKLSRMRGGRKSRQRMRQREAEMRDDCGGCPADLRGGDTVGMPQFGRRLL